MKFRIAWPSVGAHYPVMSPARRCWVAAVLAISVGSLPGPVVANELTVPVELQVELLARVTRYERTYAARTGAPARVLIVSRRDNVESVRVSAQLSAHLARAGEIGGRPVTVATHAWSNAGALRGTVRQERPDIVYLTPGFGSEIAAIAEALREEPVMTVSAVGSDVDRGAVLGFELVSSRARIAVNVTHARAHRLDFNAQFLRLVRIVR